MTRILADLPDEDIKWLDQLAAEQGKSRAAVLRDAVSAYKAQSPADGNKDWIARGAGLWKDRKDIADGVDYQRAIREDRAAYGDS
jgi:predicted transcriptional regulator